MEDSELSLHQVRANGVDNSAPPVPLPALSIGAFLQDHHPDGPPFILPGGAADSPAVRKWNSHAFWRRHAHRTVPSEVDYDPLSMPKIEHVV